MHYVMLGLHLALATICAFGIYRVLNERRKCANEKVACFSCEKPVVWDLVARCAYCECTVAVTKAPRSWRR